MDKSNLQIKNLILIQQLFGVGSASGNTVYNELMSKKLIGENLERAADIALLDLNKKTKLKTADYRNADKILSDCAENNIKIITINDTAYPDRLHNIPVPPLVLYYKGELPDIDNEPAICIVGPREISDFGKKAAYSLSYRFAKSGMIVISGAARGCDSYAHKGALKAQGRTIAVLGCGIQTKYLEENRALRDKIADNCCLISEYPPYSPASKFTFPIRNRIMSGLSLGTVVVEAKVRSGALSTAHHAAEQGRDVFVIPGNPTLPQYKGSNNLLREGAIPLIDTSDVFGAYIYRFPDKIDLEKAYQPIETIEKQKTQQKFQKKSTETLSKTAKIVYNYLDKQKFIADDLVGLGLSGDEILSSLTELEMECYIKALPGGNYEML